MGVIFYVSDILDRILQFFLSAYFNLKIYLYFVPSKTAIIVLNPHYAIGFVMRIQTSINQQFMDERLVYCPKREICY